MSIQATLKHKFPDWDEGSFANFAVLKIMLYKQRKQYPIIAQALLDLHKAGHQAELELILNELGALHGKVGQEFSIFMSHVDPSLKPSIEAGYGTPILAWAGLFVAVLSGIILLAHFLLGLEISGMSRKFGLITVNNFIAFFLIGLACFVFLKKRKQK